VNSAPIYGKSPTLDFAGGRRLIRSDPAKGDPPIMHFDSKRRRSIFIFIAATAVCLGAGRGGAEPSARVLDVSPVTFESPTLFYSTTFGGGTSEARDIAIDDS
jgi:hypothetical protein